MNKLKITAILVIVIATLVVTSGFKKQTTSCQGVTSIHTPVVNPKQNINMFVSHGHCSTPFAGHVENFNLTTKVREDLGNPLEDMKISFEVDPNSFNVCSGEELTERIKTPGLFIGDKNEKITFESTNVYTMGLDWYQINGKISIKGVVNDVKLFATGIRNPENLMPSSLVLEGQLDLHDWDIDYDKIITGKSDSVPTKWLHLNMKIDIS